MINKSNFVKYFSLSSSVLLVMALISCSNNTLSTSNISQQDKLIKSDLKTFAVKHSPSFNTQAYFLAYSDIRLAIKNKKIPDVFYHYYYSLTYEPSRVTNSNYLQIKTRIESGEWSEEAYLIANPDVKAAIDAGKTQTGYSHWYNYAITAEPSRITSSAYINAKAATDLGFSEKAYRLAYPDVDNAIKSGSLSSAYAHWNTHAKNNETSRLSDSRYLKIKAALDLSFDENTYLLAYPDVKDSVTNGSLASGLVHYLNYGLNENRLETLVYQDAKLAIVKNFDENCYRNVYPDVVPKIHNPSGGFASAFQHFALYGKHENRLDQAAYLNAKNPSYTLSNVVTTTDGFPNSYGGVALDGSGNIFIGDSSDNRLSKYDGTSVSTVTGATGLSLPTGLLYRGSDLYIVDTNNNAIKKFDGTTITNLGVTGLNKPYGMAFDSAGNLYIADTFNNAIKKFDGTTTTTVISTGLSRPFDLAFSSNGDMYIADYINNAIKKFDGTTTTTVISTGLSRPTGVKFDSSGNLFITEGISGGGTLKKFDGTTTTTVISSGLNTPYGLTVDSNDNIYIADYGSASIKKATKGSALCP